MYKACVVGHPVAHSLSPAMHNVAYKELGINCRYKAIDVLPEEFSKFMERVRNHEFIGVSVTLPFKEEVLDYVNVTTPEARMIGAVNTLYFHDGKLVGDNTDWYGVYLALHEVMKLRDKKVLVYGAGGAARSVLYALNKMKADVYLTNRTASKGKVLAKEFHAKFVDPMELPEVDVFINATSVGLPENNFLMVSEEWLKNVYLVFDLVYPNTILERTAKDLELRFISGKRMLLYQGVRQFELFTGFEAPVHQMAKVIDVSV